MKHQFTTLLSLLAVYLLAPSGHGAHATEPVPRDVSYPWMSLAKWYRMHADDVEIAERGNIDLLFIGDSITEGWGGAGKKIWDESFGKYQTANFGIGGDTTSNVLWRLQNGAVGKLSPRVIVLMIGTNNFWFTKDDPDAVVQGIHSVVNKIRNVFPGSKILLLKVFPRDQQPVGPNRAKVNLVNKQLSRLDDGKTVLVKDIGSSFLESDGTISKSVMPDFLHLSEQGYQRWASAILPTITPWLTP